MTNPDTSRGGSLGNPPTGGSAIGTTIPRTYGGESNRREALKLALQTQPGNAAALVREAEKIARYIAEGPEAVEKAPELDRHSVRKLLALSDVGRSVLIAVAEERDRQVKRGRDNANDDAYVNEELAFQAAIAIAPEDAHVSGFGKLEGLLDWIDDQSRERTLIKGIALAVAELERLARARITREAADEERTHGDESAINDEAPLPRYVPVDPRRSSINDTHHPATDEDRLRHDNMVSITVGRNTDADATAESSIQHVSDADKGGFVRMTHQSIMTVYAGAPFGTEKQFTAWTGPIRGDLDTCSFEDAFSYITKDGRAYFGGPIPSAGDGIMKVKAVELTAEDFDRMLQALGRPADPLRVTLRNSMTANRHSLLATRMRELPEYWHEHDEDEGKGPTRTFHVTEAGRKALAEWLKSNPQPYQHDNRDSRIFGE